MTRSRRTLALALALLVQVGLALGVVAPRLSARLFGEEYLLMVEPVDPIDPFRGAYVDLAYPGFDDPSEAHEVFVPLVRSGEVWRGGDETVARRPRGRPYVACLGDGGRPRCGVESLFLSQESAKRAERELAGGRALARVRIDSAGRAALLSLVAR